MAYKYIDVSPSNVRQDCNFLLAKGWGGEIDAWIIESWLLSVPSSPVDVCNSTNEFEIPMQSQPSTPKQCWHYLSSTSSSAFFSPGLGRGWFKKKEWGVLIAYSSLSVSGDDRRKTKATSPFSLPDPACRPPAFSIVPILPDPARLPPAFSIVPPDNCDIKRKQFINAGICWSCFLTIILSRAW